MSITTTKETFKPNQKVMLTQLEEGGTVDKGKVLYTEKNGRVKIEITESEANELIGTKLSFGWREGQWKYIQGNEYSSKNPGYDIQVIK